MHRFNATSLRLFLTAALAFGSASAWAANHSVTVGGTAGLAFVDSETGTNVTNVSVGDTVTFTNQTPFGFHNTRSDGPVTTFRCASGCDGAGGNGAPNSTGWTSTVTFPSVGTVNYYCEIHGSPGAGMHGTINVQSASPPGNVPITAGFTGEWYDPAQSGHGIFLEVLPNNLLAVAWFTFTPDGTQQAWFVGAGPITNDTAVVNAVLPTGGAWIPNFDPSKIVSNPWGALTFSFTDCNHGRVDFVSSYGGYGSNHMDLSRLTQPAGLTCP